jgi:uracil-DNA glycosylase
MTLLGQAYDKQCELCPRLVSHRAHIASQFANYFNAPVNGFGSRNYRVLIVGLAPGLHGAHRTGRAFTGDASGDVLFRCLHRAGLASLSRSESRRDGLSLSETRITNAVKCLPPGNRPTTEEARACQPYLIRELARLKRGGHVLALGKLAHDAVLRSLNLTMAAHAFGHGAVHALDGFTLVDTYHCSRLNMNTGRITETMLQAVVDIVADANGASS